MPVSGTSSLFRRTARPLFGGSRDAPADSVGWSYFGTSVAASSDGTTVAIGAPRDGWLPASGSLQRGAAWIYTRSGSTWSEQQKLGSPLTDEWGTEFGAAVALAANGDSLLVGAPVQAGGAVWAYTRSGSVWSEAQELTPAVPGVIPPAFGRTVALSAPGPAPRPPVPFLPFQPGPRTPPPAH